MSHRRPEIDAVEAWLVELIRATGLRADPFSLYGYVHNTNNPYGITFELPDGSSYKLQLVQTNRPLQLCSVCGRRAVAKGLCKSHYNAFLKQRKAQGAAADGDEEEEEGSP